MQMCVVSDDLLLQFEKSFLPLKSTSFTFKDQSERFKKTDSRFEFLALDYLWSNFIENHFFMKKSLCVKKSTIKKYFEKTDFSFRFLDLKNLGLSSIQVK